MDLEVLNGHPATDAEIAEIEGEFHPSDTSNVVINSCPSGGTTGQVLKKNSDTEYDASWVNFMSLFSIQLSTSEFNTGLKWIDGKTIYGKVLNVNAPSTASSWVSVATITGATRIFLVYGDIDYGGTSGLGRLVLNYSNSNFMAIGTNNRIMLYVGDSVKGKAATIIVLYTK